MMTARLWFARIVTLYAVLIFTFLAYIYVTEPLEHIQFFGITASGSPESINFLRAGPGALFSGMALIALAGLVKPAWLRTSLLLLILLDGCIVAVRLYGIVVDGVTPMQLTELRDEGISWLFFIAAYFACLPSPHTGD
jgi:hypothetical protein